MGRFLGGEELSLDPQGPGRKKERKKRKKERKSNWVWSYMAITQSSRWRVQGQQNGEPLVQ